MTHIKVLRNYKMIKLLENLKMKLMEEFFGFKPLMYATKVGGKEIKLSKRVENCSSK